MDCFYNRVEIDVTNIEPKYQVLWVKVNLRMLNISNVVFNDIPDEEEVKFSLSFSFHFFFLLIYFEI